MDSGLLLDAVELVVQCPPVMWPGERELVECLNERVGKDADAGANIPNFLKDLIESEILSSEAVSRGIMALRDKAFKNSRA